MAALQTTRISIRKKLRMSSAAQRAEVTQYRGCREQMGRPNACGQQHKEGMLSSHCMAHSSAGEWVAPAPDLQGAPPAPQQNLQESEPFILPRSETEIRKHSNTTAYLDNTHRKTSFTAGSLKEKNIITIPSMK